MACLKGPRWASLLAANMVFFFLPWLVMAASGDLQVQISVEGNILAGNVDGRVVLMFAPEGADPLEDTDVTSTPNKMFGMNVFGFGANSTVTLSGGGPNGTATGVSGFPLVSMDDVPAGVYSVQAFLNPYDQAERSDGSVVQVKFPCGDGAPYVDGVGSLATTAMDLEVQGGPQTIKLVFDSVVPVEPATGNEIGGCSQGNYADTEHLKHVKIRSEALSKFWGRDMYVGANVLLPSGYNATDKDTRYPVLYNQNHWQGGEGAYGYSYNPTFASEWDSGVISGGDNGTDKPTPKLIIVAFRHEAPFYDDSYGVNTANIGPYGDALNDELIPYLDSLFNTIAQPHARIQDGGSTGGWISAASVVFRPDLFGACFSSYPDSLDFHRHQDIPLYTNANAYEAANGTKIGSIRTFQGDKEVILATVEQENHWELVFGTASRSSLQWDVWNAAFGAQGLNGYPLEPWDKVSGEIYPDAVTFWKEMDLTEYITTHWADEKNLGEVLRERMFVYVGTHDNYYLNEGVAAFEASVNSPDFGGPGWANVTIAPGQIHGGNFQLRDTWDYLSLVTAWVDEHAPSGGSPLTAERTQVRSRGNVFADVIRSRGHGAAVARQQDPVLSYTYGAKLGAMAKASVGRWDPGVALSAQWVVDGRVSGDWFAVQQGDVVTFQGGVRNKAFTLALRVTGSKRNYKDETRESKIVVVKRRR